MFLVTHHAMSEGEVAEGSLTAEEEDGSVRPPKQGVPGQSVDVNFQIR